MIRSEQKLKMKREAVERGSDYRRSEKAKDPGKRSALFALCFLSRHDR